MGLKKAFDNIRLPDIKKILIENSISKDIIYVTEEINTNTIKGPKRTIWSNFRNNRHKTERLPQSAIIWHYYGQKNINHKKHKHYTEHRWNVNYLLCRWRPTNIWQRPTETIIEYFIWNQKNLISEYEQQRQNLCKLEVCP